MSWVDPWVGSGWVHDSKSTTISKNYVNAFKTRLDKIWLHQAVTYTVSLTLRPILQVPETDKFCLLKYVTTKL